MILHTIDSLYDIKFTDCLKDSDKFLSITFFYAKNLEIFQLSLVLHQYFQPNLTT